jgi:hypothetical protein
MTSAITSTAPATPAIFMVKRPCSGAPRLFFVRRSGAGEILSFNHCLDKVPNLLAPWNIRNSRKNHPK